MNGLVPANIWLKKFNSERHQILKPLKYIKITIHLISILNAHKFH